MAKKRKATRKGGKSKTRKNSRASAAIWLVVGALLLMGASACVLFFFRGKGPSEPVERPAYEEVLSQHRGLQEEIGRVDRAVYEVLYENGVYEDDIRFTDVGHRYAGGDAWDFTEITILLPDREAREKIEGSLLAELDRLGPEIEWWRDAEPTEESIFKVVARERLTHRIRFVVRKPAPSPPALKRRKPKVAIIVDDLGYDRGMAGAFASLDIPVSLAVLPMAPYTEEAAHEAGLHGRELMLHLPMEPKGYPEINPGPGALFRNMEDEEIRSLVVRHINQVPSARGANNHMGSSFTEQPDKIAVVLEVLQRKGMFFVDSKTTAHSVAHRLACRMGVPSVSRDVFLDNEPTVSAVDIQMERLLGVARHRGEAVGIAHPFPGTLQALRKQSARLREEVEVVTASEIVGKGR